MRPVHLNGRFLVQPFSGVQRFAREIAVALLRSGDAADIVTPPGARATSLPADVAARVRVAGGRSGHAWEQIDLPRAVRGGVLVNLGNTAPLVGVRGQIVVVHDCGWASTPEAYSRGFRLSYRVAQTWLARTGSRIVTVSAFSRGEIVRHLGIAPDRVMVIGEGADHMARIAPDPSVLAAHGLVAGGYVLVVGNLAAHKNLLVLGELATRLAARGMTLAVAGAVRGGMFRDGGSDRMPRDATYLGRVSDEALRSLYEHAACFVFPSRYEGFGLPALEAMACRCPVVASDIPALREVCGEAALYADPASPASFADAVSRVVDDPAVAQSLRAAASPRLAVHRWDRAAASLGSVARSIAGEAGAASATNDGAVPVANDRTVPVANDRAVPATNDRAVPATRELDPRRVAV